MKRLPAPEPTDIAMPLDLAYLAGYFEGEGSVCWNVQSKRPPVFTVAIQCADFKILSEFQKFFGGNIRPLRERMGVKRAMYHWQRTGIAAQNCVRQLFPYMRDGKRELATMGLECDFTRPTFHVSVEERAKRLNYATLSSAYNNRVTTHEC